MQVNQNTTTINTSISSSWAEDHSFVKDDEVHMISHSPPYYYDNNNTINDYNNKNNNNDIDEHDGMDLLQQHQDFPRLLSMARQIQDLQHQVLRRTGRAWISQQKLPNYSLTAQETVHATVNLQVYFGQLLLDTNRTVIQRGDYPITDSLLDDSLKILKKELRDITVFAANPYEQHQEQQQARTSSGKKKKKTKKATRKRPRSSNDDDDDNSVAMILSKEEAILSADNHIDDTTWSNQFPVDLMMYEDLLLEDDDALLSEFADQWLGDSRDDDDDKVRENYLQPLKRACYEPEDYDRDILDFGEQDMGAWAKQNGLTW